MPLTACFLEPTSMPYWWQVWKIICMHVNWAFWWTLQRWRTKFWHLLSQRGLKNHPQVTASKSSVLSEYPQGTVKKNFSKLTLCSHKEKVGILYYLLLGLHDKSGRAIFEIAKQRRQQNYKTFPTKKKIKECQDVANTGKASKKGRNWWQF